MKKILSVFIVSAFFGAAWSQQQTNNWYFGVNAGLTFTSGSPVVLTNGVVNTTEGCSSMSDGSGNLLFYTDGVTVYNKNHAAMPNGNGLNGDPSTTQSALIIKKPGSNTQYYIFTLPAEGAGNFCYSVVDMTLQSGNGDVTTKNIALKNNVTEKMSAVHHCNGTDVWVAIHELNTNAFYCYSVTAAGISTNAVVSNAGRLHTRVHGQMKFNNNGTRIACNRDTLISQGPPYQGTTWLDVFTFNNQTGAVSSPTVLYLNNFQKSYGVEFSRDNSKLYATYYDQSGLNGGNSELIQFNLTATNVAASGVTVGASFDPDILRGMQLASDGKIYISKANTPFLCVINSPDLAGPACSFSSDVINVDPQSLGSMCMLGLPGFQTSHFNTTFPALTTCTPTGIGPQGNISQSVHLYFDEQDKKFILNTQEYGHYEVAVFNMLGAKVSETDFYLTNANGRAEIPASGLNSGVYILKVKGPGGLHTTKLYKP